MKKLLTALPLLALFAIVLHSCKKDPDEVSTVVTASYPTITFTSPPYISITTGGSLPTIAATAYDSTLNESYPVSIVGTDALDNTTPGLYTVQATAKNRNGFVTTESVYVAVTDVAASEDLSGTYKRNTVLVNVTKLARGLYETDDVGGTGGATKTSAIFIQLNDTTIDVPAQTVEGAGDIDVVEERLIKTATDTTYQYRFSKGGQFFNTTATRVFVKQ